MRKSFKRASLSDWVIEGIARMSGTPCMSIGVIYCDMSARRIVAAWFCVEYVTVEVLCVDPVMPRYLRCGFATYV